MKKTIIIIFLSFVFGSVVQSQEPVPFPLKNFLETYTDSINSYFLQDELVKPFSSRMFFLNEKDSLLWPDNYRLTDKYFKTRISPVEAFSQFGKFKNMSSISYYYSRNQLGSLKLVKSRSTKFYDKYRINLTEEHVFNSREFFGGTDSIVKRSNYFDIVSWFVPSGKDYSYVYKINRIVDEKPGSTVFPDKIGITLNYYFPALRSEIPNLTRLSGSGSVINASWLLGGRNYINYSLGSGVGYTSYRFDMEHASFQFSDNGLFDKDEYPFTLKTEVKNLYQTLSFNTLHIPFLAELSGYSRNGRFSGTVFGGVNINFPLNPKLTVSEGEVTYAGKYKFDFYNDSILLQNLDSYHFMTYSAKEITSSAPKLATVYLTAEIGGELNWYLGKNWIATMNLGYMQSMTPLWSGKQNKLAYNVVDLTSGKKTFEPVMNSFLALNETSRLDAFRLGFGISYLLNKPVIPNFKVGLTNKETKKLVRDRLVLSSGSFNPKSNEKILYVLVADSASTGGIAGQKLSYRFVGPSPKFYRQGKISASSRISKLSFPVPASNSGAELFLEEPYGYQLSLDKSLEVVSGGKYGEMKAIRCDNLWKPEDDRRNLTIGFSRLKPLQLCIVNYKYSLDEFGRHRESIISQISQDARDVLGKRMEMIIYIASDQPETFRIQNNSEFDNIIDLIDIKLRNTDEVYPGLQKLKDDITGKGINPRRNINLKLFASYEFIDEGRKLAENLSRTLVINNDYVNFVTYLHNYGRGRAPGYENSLNVLKKIGVIVE